MPIRLMNAGSILPQGMLPILIRDLINRNSATAALFDVRQPGRAARPIGRTTVDAYKTWIKVSYFMFGLFMLLGFGFSSRVKGYAISANALVPCLNLSFTDILDRANLKEFTEAFPVM